MNKVQALEIKFSDQLPPKHIYKKAQVQFGVDFNNGIIFVYGDTIHTKYKLTDDLYAHESTHVRQQAKIGPDRWWELYLALPEFRLEQEKEAYVSQVKQLKKDYRSREKLFKELHRIAKDLSGPMYGRLITYQEALSFLRKEI